MQYFSLSTHDGTHIGFLVMTTDDYDESSPQSGQFAVKIQDENHRDSAVLNELASATGVLFWRTQGDRVVLYDEAENLLGFVRQEWLLFSGKQFVLTDLTGTL